MVSVPNSPLKAEDKENHIIVNSKKKPAISRRHSLAPSKSILKHSNREILNEQDSNHTITIMQKLPSREQTQTVTSNRRVSFAPEVTLHKIDMIPQFFEPSPRKQPRRRDTLQFVPPLRNNDDEFEDRIEEDSSDMDIDDDDNLSKSPFIIYQDEERDEDEEINSLFEESVAAQHRNLQVDEVDKLKSSSSSAEESYEHQLPHENDEEVDMELTVHQGENQFENMEITEYQQQTLESYELLLLHNVQEMELTNYQGHVSEAVEDAEEEMDLTVFRSKEIETIVNQDNDEMELTVHQGNLLLQDDSAENMDLTIYQGQNIELSTQPLAHSTQSQTMPLIATKQLSHISELTEPEEEAEAVPKRNPVLERFQKRANSSFDSSELEANESSMEATTTAFGDPSIFENILRVTGGSQDEEEEVDLPVPSSNKRTFSTPRKSLTTDDGSPQERSSSLKKRKLSFTPEGKTLLTQEEANSPLTVHSVQYVEPLVANVPSTPLKESLILSSPKKPDIEEMINSLTPKRAAARRESFGYVSQSPRRRSLTEEVSLTPLRVAKAATNNSLNLGQAVVTTTMPLAGNDDSQEMGDITDDYIPVNLKTFLKAANVKFYDDLNVRDTSNDLMLETYGDQSPDLCDYLSGLQKLKNFEVINFSCKELKKNIEEGKELFEALEKEIVEENPPLIREYFEAEPAVQGTMNFQFQVLKNYARQQAKNVWYGWRSKLVEGAYQSLHLSKRVLEDSKLKLDINIEELQKHELKLREELQYLNEKFEKLTKHKLEFDDCDKDELLSMRSRLISISQECSARKETLKLLNEESNKLQDQLKIINQQVIDVESEVNDVKSQIKLNEIYSWSDIKLMQIKFSILESINGLRLTKYEPNIIKMMIDNVEISYNTETNTSDFNFNKSNSLIINGFQSNGINDEDSGITKIFKFLENYNNLKKLDSKIEKLRLFSNNPIRLIIKQGTIYLIIKELNACFKRIISFPIDSNFFINQKLDKENMKIETISYNGEQEVSDNIEEVEKLLQRFKLI